MIYFSPALLSVPRSIGGIMRGLIMPGQALSWLTLFVWPAGLAVTLVKTGNLFGPNVAHGVDNFVSKVLYPLQI
ncbi:MAG: hypothetical protein ACETVM_05240 [Candidatus Bathyarchaeia archaeon]